MTRAIELCLFVGLPILVLFILASRGELNDALGQIHMMEEAEALEEYCHVVPDLKPYDWSLDD